MATSRMMVGLALVGLLCVTGCKRKPTPTTTVTTNSVTTDTVTPPPAASTLNAMPPTADTGDNHNPDPTLSATSSTSKN